MGQWWVGVKEHHRDEVTSYMYFPFKGTVSRDFRLAHSSVSPKLENSRRYSRLKVHHRCQQHRWQMETIFKQKNFNNFFWAPLGSRVNIYIKFCLQVHFKVSAAWYCSHYLPPVSTAPVSNLHLDLRISPRIFEKIRNDPTVIFRGLGEGDSWKKPEAKDLVTLW